MREFGNQPVREGCAAWNDRAAECASDPVTGNLTRNGLQMKKTFLGGLVMAAATLCGPAMAQDIFPGGNPQFAPHQFNRNANELAMTNTSLQDGPPIPDAVGPPNDEYVHRLETLEKAFADKVAADKSAASKLPSLKISGRIHLDVWDFPHASPGIGYFENPTTGVDPESRIAFRRIRLTFRGDVTETIMYRFDLEFADPSNPQYRDAFLGFRDLPVFQTLLIGNQKRPLGLDHLNSSNDNVFLERPEVVEAFNEDARRVGIASYGVTEDELYHWRYGAYALENTQATGQSVGDSFQMSGNARLCSSPWYDESSGGRGYFHWGIAGMVANPDGEDTSLDTNNNDARFRTRAEARSTNRWLDTGRIAGADTFEIAAWESMLNVGAFQLTSEYQSNWVQRQNGTEVFFHGGYVQVAYTLTGEHIPYDRATGTIGTMEPFENFFLVNRCSGGHGGGWGAWQVGVRYSHLDLTDDNIGGGVGDDLTVALNWIWSKNAKWQFNYVAGQIEQRGPVAGYTDGNYSIFGTRFMIFF